MLFCNQSMKVFPRGRTGVRSCCGAKLSKTRQAQEDAWAHSCSFRNHLLLRGPSVGEGIQSGKRGKSVLFKQ
jgi:hypothetical protein